jgi:hypothetical protein
MADESQPRVVISNKDDPPNFDPTKNPSDVESDNEREKDIVSLDALSQEELQYIIGNSTYRDILSDLLSPFVDGNSETGSVISADHTVTDNQSQKSTKPVVYKLANRQEEGVDTSSSQAKKKALKRPSEGSSSPSKKRRRVEPEISRKRKSGAGALVSPAKKPKVSPQSSSASESENESFDPTLEREDKDDFKVKVPRTIEKYIDKHFRRSLSKEERTAMLKKHPKPDVEAALPPKLDSFVADFAGKKLDKARDSQLAKIQGAMLYAAGPLTNLWADLIEQGLANDSDAAIHVSDILETIQRSLVLLGNANSLISETRREIALESIHPSLKKYGRGEFAKAKADLFGQEFKDTLVKKVEADSALSKAVSIVSKSSGSTSKMYQKPTGNRFFGSRTSRYGAASGKVYQPYHRFQGKGKQTPNKPYFKKGSVFDRLGANQSDRNQSNSQQNK